MDRLKKIAKIQTCLNHLSDLIRNPMPDKERMKAVHDLLDELLDDLCKTN